MNQPFNNEKFIFLQKDAILKRASKFHKLYIEVGGKLFDDLHASRVLPGYDPQNKLNILLSLKEQAEIVIAINSNDIKNRKIRNDLGITYDVEVERLIKAFKKAGMDVNSVVFSFYEPNQEVDKFMRKLKGMKIATYKHYKIAGYPQDTATVVSENGLGRNEYIKTTKDIVLVTAPGPGSGKMATCLSQLYHDKKHGIVSGYAKFETFPVWNLGLNHPLNVAYEAATVDLNDVNMIDPYHLEAYGESAVNYNRDIEVFPLLRNIFNTISSEVVYKSPTDMGVNKIAFAIEDEDAIKEAANQEIIRRYYETKKNVLTGKYEEDKILKSEMLLNRLQLDPNNRKVREIALQKAEKLGVPTIALELSDGRIVTGKRSKLLSQTAALLLNALKTLAGINDNIPLLSPSVIEPIVSLKVDSLKKDSPVIHGEEILVALAIQANTNPLADLAIKQLPMLKNLEAHASCILNVNDLKLFQQIGVRMTEEARNYILKN